MSETTETFTITKPTYTKLKLVTAHGPVYRSVSSEPPRDASPDEIPLIDISGLYGDLEARKSLLPISVPLVKATVSSTSRTTVSQKTR